MTSAAMSATAEPAALEAEDAKPAAAKPRTPLSSYLPGLVLSLTIAAAAVQLSALTDFPAVLVALGLGMVLSGFSDDRRYAPGLTLSARTVLRIAVALLGAKMTFSQLGSLGWQPVCVVIASVGATLLGGYVIGRLLGLRRDLSWLSAGAVAICGASATLAISAILPKTRHQDTEVIVTVAGVTIIGSMAMVAFPALASFLGLSALETGAFLGGTIHEVAQAVAAGLSVSEPVGDIATALKLLRVACLVPIVFALGIAFKTIVFGERPQWGAIIPWFLFAFLALAGAASAGMIPAPWVKAFGEISKWGLLMALGALGTKTSLRAMFAAGIRPALALVAQSAFLAITVLLGLLILRQITP